MAEAVRYTIFKVKWGFFGLLVSKNGLLRISLPTQTAQLAEKYLLVGINSRSTFDQEVFRGLQDLISAYFDGGYVDFNSTVIGPIRLGGSDFSKKILKTCMTIKFGKTISYGHLAERAGFAGAARAVGAVLARNRLPLIIPCHRIIRSDGKVGGFSAAGGVKMKKKMLELEQVHFF